MGGDDGQSGQTPETGSLVVGVGASTGGLDALIELLVVTAPGAPAARLTRHERLRSRADDAADLDEVLTDVIAVLRRTRGNDFSGYKASALRRRLQRRLDAHDLSVAADYVPLLETDREEQELLFRELLIGVTSFFRDPAAYEALAVSLRELLDSKPDGEPVRGWVAGCSTGEEAYSIAILLQEAIADLARRSPVHLFATDIDPRAIEVARAGVFPRRVEADVGADRVRELFVDEGAQLRIRQEVRETLVFGVQSLIQDPPITGLDLLVCRNLLIYFDGPLQRRVRPLFHHSLRPGGLLFLGSSEAIGPTRDGFDLVDPRWKIFRRRSKSSTP